MPAGIRRRLKRAGFLLGAASILGVGPWILERAPQAIPGVAVSLAGDFSEGGALPASVARTSEQPFWSAWTSHDRTEGVLRLGPFPAPRVLGLQVVGFPHVQANQLFLEDVVSGERLDLTESNLGDQWEDIRLPLPLSWRNRSVFLHAAVHSSGAYGWLAVGPPQEVPVFAQGWSPFFHRLYGFVGSGLVLFLLQAVSLGLLRDRWQIPVAFLPLATVALIAGVAYGVFWIFLAQFLIGRVAVWLLLTGACARFIFGEEKDRRGPDPGSEKLPLVLALAIGVAYFGLLFLYRSDRPMYDVSARRFCDTLAVDNQLPEMFAERLIHGLDPRRLASGWWFSSERPPLQCAFDLLVAYPVSVSGVDFSTAAQATGIWLQLSWVLAAWGWLRSLKASVGNSLLIIACVAPSGFLALNTLYVWPKLLAAALVVGGFSLFFMVPAVEKVEARQFAAGGILIALGFLSHASVAFSLLGLIPFAVARLNLRRMKSWAAAAAGFAVLILPWIAYQRWYDPPGNYLVKWYLGGATVRDPRGVAETIISAYRSQAFAMLGHTRITNLADLFRGPWREWLTVNGADLAARRNAEYYSVFFALGWWNLGWVAVALLLFRAGRARPAENRGLPVAVLWSLSTLAVWVLLLFIPNSAVIHQGSYACMLMLYLSLALSLWALNRWLFAGVALAEWLNFLRVWMPANPTRPGPINPHGVFLACVGVAAVGALLVWSRHFSDPPTQLAPPG